MVTNLLLEDNVVQNNAATAASPTPSRSPSGAATSGPTTRPTSRCWATASPIRGAPASSTSSPAAAWRDPITLNLDMNPTISPRRQRHDELGGCRGEHPASQHGGERHLCDRGLRRGSRRGFRQRPQQRRHRDDRRDDRLDRRRGRCRRRRTCSTPKRPARGEAARPPPPPRWVAKPGGGVSVLAAVLATPGRRP